MSVPASTYVELGACSAFSFLRGASPPEELAEQAAALGLPAMALTDRGGVYGAPRFFRATRARGLRALVGARVRVEGVGEIRLLCANRTGYANLCQLLSRGHAAQAKGVCLVHPAALAEHAAGLHCLAGPRLRSPLIFSVDTLEHIFSKECLNIELVRHYRRQTSAERRLSDLAAARRLPVVATNDVHFARREDKRLHDVLTCIRRRTTLDQAGRALWPNAEACLKSASEMAALFADRPAALARTQALAERCAFTLDDLGYRFPDFPVPAGETPDGVLRALVDSGAIWRYRSPSAAVRAQLTRELALIEKLGLAGYFLIVWDLVRFARDRGILAQGRGSAANSAVCYALGITAVDPVGMGLLFERFLSEERGEWPDIDLDLPSGDRREQVIQYVYSTYGAHGAAMTANVITFRERSAAREVGKALGFGEAEREAVANRCSRWPGSEPAGWTERIAACGLSPTDRRVRQWAELSAQILHLPRHLGQHSGGMVIARGRLDAITPIEPAAMPGRSVIQWDKDDCAALKIIKVDLLGLGMLAALEEAVPLIRQSSGVAIDYAHLPQDPAVYARLCAADTVGVFQVESRAQMATLPRLRPRCFYDLVIEIALIRPGPITGQMVHPYLRRRAGLEPVTYPHPSLEPILARTLGVPIFQEQIMRMAMVIAGFSGGEAEELRRAMGFKRAGAAMRAIEERLRQGMRTRGIDDAAQDQVVAYITSFASYGFPESHSASFALIAYASAYLKLHHPAAFLCALLNAWPMGFYHPATLVKDAQRHGVRVLPIDATRSLWRCTLEDGAVRLGLRYVLGLRESSGARLVGRRDERPFASLADLERRCRLSDGELTALAELGAFARLGCTRRQALWQVARLRERTDGMLGAIDPSSEPAPLAEMNLAERLAADYRRSQLSVGPHPMRLVRPTLPAAVCRAIELRRLRDRQRVEVAGLTTVSQRPATAKGFFFVTLEDETGFANLIFTPARFAEHRELLGRAVGLWAEGRLQNREGVVHVRVDRLRGLALAPASPARRDGFDQAPNSALSSASE